MGIIRGFWRSSLLLAAISISSPTIAESVTVNVGDTLGIQFRFTQPFTETPNGLIARFSPSFSSTTNTLYDGRTSLGSGNFPWFFASDNTYWCSPGSPSGFCADFTSIRNQSITGLATQTILGGSPFEFDPTYAAIVAQKWVSTGPGSSTATVVGSGSIRNITVNGDTVWAPEGAITSSMLLASVAGASASRPSTGEAVGGAVNYILGPGYGRLREQSIECSQDLACDIDGLESKMRGELVDVSEDLDVATRDIGITLVTMPIGYSSVDMSVWNSTLVAKVMGFYDFVDDLKSKIQNSIDFFKEVFSTNSTSPLRVAAASASEPVIINSISGNMYWDGDGSTSWLLSDLQINVDISKDYFPDIETGLLLGSIGSLYPGGTGFGVFTVGDIVDPPGYNTVTLSFQHLDYFATPIQVPTPATLILLSIGLVGLSATKLCRKYRR